MEQQASAGDFKKNVLLLKPGDVTKRGDRVLTPTLNTLSQLRKTEQFMRDVVFSRNMSAIDVRKKLVEAFPALENKRFSCAKRVNRESADLDFKGDRRVWDGETVKRLPGKSAMYIVVEDETSQVQGAANQTDCLSDGQHASSYTPPDLEGVNPGRFDVEALWKDLADLISEDCKNSDGLRSCQNQTIQTVSGRKISETSEPNRIDVNTGEISETGYSSEANSTPAQGLCQETAVTTGVTRSSFRIYQTRETACSSDEASSTQRQGLFQETAVVTATQNPSRLFHGCGTADSSDEGSSSKEQTFNVEMNPPKGRPEGGNRCFWLKFKNSLPSSVASAWATFGAYGSAKVRRISDDDFTMFHGKKIPSGRPGVVTVTITSETGCYLGKALFEYEDPENETKQQVLCNKRKIEELSGIVENLKKMFKQRGLVIQEGQVEPQYILKALVYAAAEAGALKLIEKIFSLSAGRVAFQAYKEDVYLPEDIADENGHRDVAAYLRATTKRYSEEYDISTDQSRSVAFDWTELANALEDIELNQSVTKPSSDKDLNQIWEDDIIETGYSADGETSSSGSEKENSDSDAEFVKMSICRGNVKGLEQSERDVLKAHRILIADNLQERRVVEQLFAEGILNLTDREEINAETSRFGKCCLLLDKLPRKGPNAFQSFLQALRLSGQGFLADKLSGESSTDLNLTTSRSFGLPNKVPKFFGRTNVCEEISMQLTHPETTLISLIAPPGFGKTAVAITVGHEMLEKGRDVLYVSLRTVNSVEGAAKRLLEVIGIKVGKDPVSQVKCFLSLLRNETMLVLDNAEDLQNARKSAFNQFLEEVGQHGKHLVILITSRNPLSVFDCPFFRCDIPLKPLDDEASFFFLKHYAPNISDQLARHFAKPKVCGGVPLVLKLTASFLESKTIDPIDLHRMLRNCPHSFLKQKEPKIQQFFSLLKVFYNNLRPEAKKGLSRLAAFPSVFTIMEAKNVLFCTDDYLDFQLLLNNLVSYSVVQEEEVDNHLQYSLHPLVRAFCIACREDECKGYNMATRLFSYHYLALLQRLNDGFITTNCQVAIYNYQMSKANIAHALSASTEDDVLKCYGIKVSTETVHFLATVMNYDEFLSTYEKLLEVAEKLPDKTLYSECLLSIGFRQLCYYSYSHAHRTIAKLNLQRAHDLQIDLRIYDTECQGHCKCKLGLCTFLAGDRKKGISLIAQGIGVRRKLVRSNHSGKMERMLLADGFCDLAMALFTSGKHKAALNILENICLVKYRELLGTHPFTASLLDHIGKIYQALGKPWRAVALAKESLRMRLFLLGDDNPDIARSYYGLGCALKELGCTQEALENLMKAQEIQHRVIASIEDIERTEREINSLRGSVGQSQQSYTLKLHGISCPIKM